MPGMIRRGVDARHRLILLLYRLLLMFRRRRLVVLVGTMCGAGCALCFFRSRGRWLFLLSGKLWFC